jgi:hypothetical protein
MSRCEALVLVKGMTRRPDQGLYVVCGQEGAHLHHKVTRSRGGLLLDAVGETYHQMYLCAPHHAIAHDEPAFENGLLIRGSVVSGPDGRPVYTGPDEYLIQHYGEEVHT